MKKKNVYKIHPLLKSARGKAVSCRLKVYVEENSVDSLDYDDSLKGNKIAC